MIEYVSSEYEIRGVYAFFTIAMTFTIQGRAYPPFPSLSVLMALHTVHILPNLNLG